MVERVALVLVDQLPGDLDVEALLVHDEPIRVERIKEREIACGEEAIDRKACAGGAAAT